MKNDNCCEALALLEQGSRGFSIALDTEEIAEALARVVIPAIGEWCVVDLLEAGNMRRIHAYHANPAHAGAMHAIERWHPVLDCTPVARALETGTPQIVTNASDCAAYLGHIDGRMLEGRCAIVPIIARTQTLGLLAIVSCEAPRLADMGLRIAEQLAERAALALYAIAADEAHDTAVKQRDDFISVATHELRTPLTAILLRLQILQRLAVASEPLGSATLMKCVEPMLGQVRRLSQMIDTLLDVDRMKHRQVELDRVKMDLCEATRDVGKRLQVLAEASHTELNVTACEPLLGFWDSVRLDQILTNLISNAIKYGRNAPVEIRVESDEDFARVHVTDRGIGIAPENHEKVFQQFFRIAAHTRHDSLGLGLYIARKLARAHGGDITVRSEIGKGTTFTLELPRDLDLAVQDTIPG